MDQATFRALDRGRQLWNIFNSLSGEVDPYTASAIDGKTVTTSTGEVLAANASRRNAVIVNYGATNGAFLGIGVPAVAGKGIYLAPNGGSYEINDQNLNLLAINAITASSTTTLSIHEGT